MLRSLHLGGFKCFTELYLELAPLTVLTGVNGGGKSSVIQALMLLAQTMSQREWGRTLLLEGPDLSLGSAADVFNHRSPPRRLTLGVATEDESIKWNFTAEDRRALSLQLDGAEKNGVDLEVEDPIRCLLPLREAELSSTVSSLRSMSWVTAERMGPRELLPLRDEQGHRYVGPRGELAAGLLYWRESDAVRVELCLPETPQTLYHQVRARMHEIFPGCDLRVSPIDGANAVSLRLRSDPRSDFHRPQNVGFGITQLFPIVVAVLAAKPGEILLIENPEVHLHPRAQQHIGMLLSMVAASGVQLIVETHSDHVLNGIRLAVKNRRISKENVAMHFFSQDAGTAQLQSPTIDGDGRLDSWPAGFFDQFDLALSELL